MLRKMELDDLDQVLNIENFVFNDAWTREHYHYEILENPYSIMYVYEENNHVLGYIGFWITFELCQLVTIAVSPSFQGRGIASLMIRMMEQEALKNACDTISLEVRVSNDAAKQLYSKCGFFEVGIRKRYYSDNFEDALLYAKGIGE